MKANGQANTAAIAQLLAGLLAGGQLSGKKAGQLARAGKRSKGKGRTKLSDEELAVAKKANEAEAIEKFTKAGYKDVQPRVNVKSAKLWIAEGRVPAKGQKAIKVGPGYALFHIDQTVPLTATTASETTH